MSRIGKTPIQIPTGVTVTIQSDHVSVQGTKGTLSFVIPRGIVVTQENNVITVDTKHTDRASRALHGFVRAHIANLVVGVNKGWTKTLEMVGVGYRAALAGANLVLSVGFSHQVTIVPPQGITFAVQEGKIVVSGIDKQAVGQAAADIRKVKKPEPYKGKGIKYQGEYVRKKAGKSAKGVGGAPGAK